MIQFRCAPSRMGSRRLGRDGSMVCLGSTSALHCTATLLCLCRCADIPSVACRKVPSLASPLGIPIYATSGISSSMPQALARVKWCFRLRMCWWVGEKEPAGRLGQRRWMCGRAARVVLPTGRRKSLDDSGTRSQTSASLKRALYRGAIQLRQQKGFPDRGERDSLFLSRLSLTLVACRCNGLTAAKQGTPISSTRN